MTDNTIKSKVRIILAITGKDILDAIKNKTILSTVISALFLFFFYLLFPILEEQEIIYLYDAGKSTWIPALENSNPFTIQLLDTQEAVQTHLSDRGEPELGLILPVGLDQAAAAGGPVNIQGYLLNWVSQKQASQLVSRAETQISGVISAPVNIVVERLFMLPETTGIALSRGVGSLLLILMIGVIMIPHLILEERRARTMDALMVSPATAGQITLGKALVGFIYCFLGCVIIWLFNSNLIIQWWLALLAGIGTALFCVMLGLCLGTFIVNRQQLLIMANFTIFPLVIATFMYAAFSFIPSWLRTLAGWLPTSITFDLFRLSLTPSSDLSFVVVRVAVMIIYIFILLGLVSWKIRRLDWM
jgi:hypothetical protein